MFSPFGTVISTRILRDNNGVSRGVGFCRMESKEKCSQIIEAFNGHMVQGKYNDSFAGKKHTHKKQVSRSLLLLSPHQKKRIDEAWQDSSHAFFWHEHQS